MNYGTITFQATPKPTWIITCQPHVMIRLKRHFERINKKEHGTVRLSATPENSRELEWFLQRYPMEVDQPEVLQFGVRKHREREEHVQALLQGRRSELLGAIEMALPAREYQLIAAQLAVTTGRLLLADEVGLGKAQPLDANILTPDGWVPMGEIRVGQTLIDPDGGICKVTGVYPQGEREVYRVTTSDGSSAECCDEHLWMVQTSNDRHRGYTSRVLPLSRFKDRLYRVGRNRTSNYFIPVAQPTTFNIQSPLPLDPWLLGLLVGDGCFRMNTVSISVADEQILEMVRKSLPEGITAVYTGSYDYRLSRGRKGSGNIVAEAIRKLGLHNKKAWEKRIPDRVLRASVPDRIEFLRGLMDADGDCSKGGVCTLGTSSPGLADDVEELVGSLGGFASRSQRLSPKYVHKGETRFGRTAYRVNMRLPFCPFRCDRKADRWKMPYMARPIRAVEYVGRKPVQCIRVSSKRSLYITDGYIVTHNTCSSIAMIAMSGKLPALIVTLTHLPRQWAAELAKFCPGLSCHILKKATPYPLEVDGTMPDVIISNYHKLSGWADVLAPVIRAVIFDEAHELRRAESAKYSAAKHLAEACDLRAGLTATPIFNYGGEMFNVLNVLEEGCLGTKDEFHREWCKDHGEDGKILIDDPKAFGTYLQDQGLMLRRSRKDVGRELPALTIVPHVIEIDEAELAAVEGVAGELARLILSEEKMEKGVKFQAGGELDFRLRQATGLAKAPFVAEFVRLLIESGEKVLLYGWHHLVYDVWATKLQDLKPAFFTGKTSQAEKALAKRRFLDGETNLLIMSLRAGAGLDGLQAVCRNVVYGELDWSPAVHHQATGRVYRDGQEHPVMAYFPIATSGSDPVVADVLGVKRGQLDGIIDPDAPLVDTGVDPNHIRRLAMDVLRRMESKPAKPDPPVIVAPKPVIATPIHDRSRTAWTEQPSLFGDLSA